MNLRTVATRALWAAVVLLVLRFAIEGGESGASDLWKQTRDKHRLIVETDSMQRLVDSLAAYRKRLDTDAALQERIAREEFGMVKPNELQYRLTSPASDSAKR